MSIRHGHSRVESFAVKNLGFKVESETMRLPEKLFSLVWCFENNGCFLLQLLLKLSSEEKQCMTILYSRAAQLWLYSSGGSFTLLRISEVDVYPPLLTNKSS